MPVPSPRNSIRIARGDYTDLNANVGSLGEGELVYAVDQDQFYTVSSGALAAIAVPQDGTTSQKGVVQLTDSTSSTSTTTAATPNAVKSAYDLAAAALPKSGGTMTGQVTLAEIKEGTYTLGTTGSIALDPANGSIQKSVLTGAPTFTDSLEAGQIIVLMLENGSSYTVTWPTMTWVTSVGNSAPTLTAKDAVVLWKMGTTLYGANTGSYV